MSWELQNDAVVFGTDQWIYCTQHLAVHSTGWCTVGTEDKIGLGILRSVDIEGKKAAEKCRRVGLKLFQDKI